MFYGGKLKAKKSQKKVEKTLATRLHTCFLLRMATTGLQITDGNAVQFTGTVSKRHLTVLTIKKLDKASQSFGRGDDQARTPARWGIFVDGTLRGTIVGKPQSYMDKADWTVYKIGGATVATYRPIKSFLKTRRAAVDWVQAHQTEFC